MALAGSMSIELTDGGASGTARLTVTQTQVALTGPCNTLSPPPLSLVGVAVTGGPSALTFTEIGRSSGGGTTGTTTTRFTGSLSGTTITGTVSIEEVQTGSTVTPDADASGSAEALLRVRLAARPVAAASRPPRSASSAPRSVAAH